ncbi:e3 ubiquitin-protein ligase rnf8-like isoform x1 [Plasmopara halstedii]|uniref:RING finger protein 141 n=1 Tax=Plasmopara halstedii TaxID=4781 RepID=A0A0P1B071_PLAHL|nr:e3 ubiquitin-protein ligase rnf8-like isoform x1 [Plasmopara halstedii]CEG47506.1 e3 ubiquitin-protein ligase rnf8-like isoform x1 [Plasmopara halstedii]|eukprot:XP_024583875.1 e3 ubiquitin-protein ligase rnf8-like isoform x1 [Plasmopara halstedii]
MGQTTSIQEDKMKKRIRQTMGTFMDFGTHLKNANEWAQICATPKNCYLSFRIVINPEVSAELLPYLWRIRGNVAVEVRKMRRTVERQANLADFRVEIPRDPSYAQDYLETIGQAKTLTIAQFYYIYCFLSDVKACAAHTVRFSEKTTSTCETEFDETECQICMDKKKQVVLPCAHSFCLNCFQHWSTQSETCPICRTVFNCSEGDELWHLASNEVEDLGSYATDLVARIYEFLDKREKSKYTEEDIKRSVELYSAAVSVKQTPLRKFVYSELFPTALPLGVPSILRSGIRFSTEHDSDLMLALEVAAGQDQYAAMQHYEQLKRDQILASTMALQSDIDESPNES